MASIGIVMVTDDIPFLQFKPLGDSIFLLLIFKTGIFNKHR
jgi:hypothetical protein